MTKSQAEIRDEEEAFKPDEKPAPSILIEGQKKFEVDVISDHRA